LIQHVHLGTSPCEGEGWNLDSQRNGLNEVALAILEESIADGANENSPARREASAGTEEKRMQSRQGRLIMLSTI
jgi:hypothetical protein